MCFVRNYQGNKQFLLSALLVRKIKDECVLSIKTCVFGDKAESRRQVVIWKDRLTLSSINDLGIENYAFAL